MKKQLIRIPQTTQNSRRRRRVSIGSRFVTTNRIKGIQFVNLSKISDEEFNRVMTSKKV